MRRFWNWLTRATRYYSGGEIGPASHADGAWHVLSRDMVSFDGGETWQYTDEDPVLDKLNRRNDG